MDFLDSLDLDESNKKSRRVRSWYLYEQFKSLERNQLDAARQLKDRSYQDKILRRELSERKARRKLYDQIGVSRSESRTERFKKEGIKTSLNASTADIFGSFHDLRNVGQDKMIAQDIDCCSPDDSQTGHFYDNYHIGKFCRDDLKSMEDQPNDNSCDDSINSSLVNAKSNEIVDDIEYNENKLQKMELNFEEVKEKLHCLEKLTHMRDYDQSSVNESLCSDDEKPTNEVVMQDKNVNTSDTNNIYLMWSKLVSFAYQVMQLNHGNCYYDYGSQFLTAVLACDVLRRGINRMCHILQPYVSPIKFASDSEYSVENIEDIKRKKLSQKHSRNHKYKKPYQSYSISKTRPMLQAYRKHRSEDFWDQTSSKYSPANGIRGHKYRMRSEPWKNSISGKRGNINAKSSYHSIWPVFSNEDNKIDKSSSNQFCKCGRRKVLNPMLKLSQYLDCIMKDIDDTLSI